jgi:hypothetical protein
MVYRKKVLISPEAIQKLDYDSKTLSVNHAGKNKKTVRY